MHNYKNLHIWQEGINLARKIYEVTGNFPANEKYGIVSQMTRAAVSIPSNIAEGAGRNSNKDFANFLSIAIGSIFELHTQIAICEQIGYINEETTKQLEQQIYTLQQQITTYKQRIEGSAPRQGETSPTSESKK
ncbi:MAG: four helix bundle protein [Paludibacteraceae bacterium]|jgi:four helix bundle protein|nr:four helix bundle protein [Paludibacteraceae bacterium]